MLGSTSTSVSLSRRALRVPEITLYFWIIKGLTTAMGEATSDYLVRVVHPVPAVLLGFVGFLVALALQLSMRRYLAWTYWFAVAMVGVFGTMAADVLHVGFGVPYFASALFYAVALALIFAAWQMSERTLSIHSIDTARREAFYWAVVVATFALGTALGDMTATTLHLGYFFSILLFAGMIGVPAIGYFRFNWNPIFSFWFAYVVTRPLGASFADWVGRPLSSGGLGWGEGRLSLLLSTVILCFVAYLALTRKDVQGGRDQSEPIEDTDLAYSTRGPWRPIPLLIPAKRLHPRGAEADLTKIRRSDEEHTDQAARQGKVAQRHEARRLYRGKGISLFEDRIETRQGVARFREGHVEATVHFPAFALEPQVIVDTPNFVSVVPSKPRKAERLANLINRTVWTDRQALEERAVTRTD